MKTTKIKAVAVVLTRGEGPNELCGKSVRVGGANPWAAADGVLLGWSETAPDAGGYNKCDFCVEFADGETYEGRYDLVHHDVELPDLAQHVLDFVAFYAGTRRPAQMTEAGYVAFLKQVDEEQLADFRTFLAGYDIGGLNDSVLTTTTTNT